MCSIPIPRGRDSCSVTSDCWNASGVSSNGWNACSVAGGISRRHDARDRSRNASEGKSRSSQSAYCNSRRTNTVARAVAITSTIAMCSVACTIGCCSIPGSIADSISRSIAGSTVASDSRSDYGRSLLDDSFLDSLYRLNSLLLRIMNDGS